eukprot:2636666-Amphidinium_carterae.1
MGHCSTLHLQQSQATKLWSNWTRLTPKSTHSVRPDVQLCRSTTFTATLTKLGAAAYPQQSLLELPSTLVSPVPACTTPGTAPLFDAN